MPVCAELLDAAAAAGEIRPGTDAFGLLYAVGNLCAGADGDGDGRYDARRMVGLLIAGSVAAPGGPLTRPRTRATDRLV